MHQVEYEVKVLNIDKPALVAKLRKLGAKETPEYLCKRYIFDLESENIEFIRLRKQQDVTTLTYKFKPLGNVAVGKTTELDVTVSDFDKMAEILSKVKFKRVLYQENLMHVFDIDGIEYAIATWPKISPYVEVEAASEERVAEGLKLVGFEGRDSGDLDLKEVYRQVGLSLNDIPELRFD